MAAKFLRATMPFMKRMLPFVALLSVFGCQTETTPIGGTVPDKVYARVVSLSPSVTELVALLNATNVLAGRTSGDNRPNYIKQVTIVANPSPDIEKIVQLQADLVIAEENLINPNELQKLKEIGSFDVEVIDIDSLEDWEEAVYRLGALLQAHTRASEVVDRVQQAISNAKLPDSMYKPKVMVAMSPTTPWVAGTKSFQADVVRAAGGEPVGPDADRFVATNPESIVQWSPDILFVSDDPEKFSGAPWSTTRAGRAGEVLEVYADILLRPGADVERLIEAMSKEIRRVGSTR
jgi:ABC-type Fe3+-hydroxamate transport system substrate-binding protein